MHQKLKEIEEEIEIMKLELYSGGKSEQDKEKIVKDIKQLEELFLETKENLRGIN